MNTFNKLTLAAGSLALIGSVFVSNGHATEHGFSDTDGHWAEEEILYLSDLDYLSGYPDGSFRPNEYITRAEVASIMFHQQDLSESDAIYPDVSTNYWAFGKIGAVQQAEIMTGYPDGSFRPLINVTRAETAKIFSNTFEYDFDGEDIHSFHDVSETHWAYDEIHAMRENHLLGGYRDGSFRPGNPITRAEFSVVMAREMNEDFREDLILMEKADVLLDAIMDEDFETVSAHAHPTEGVRFSPYVYVQGNHRVFHSTELEDWLDDDTVYLWGTEDGTGDNINKTVQEYYERFVIRKDYQNPDERVYNQVVTRGSLINNIQVFFPNAKFMEYYVSGDDEKFGGLDWGSLVLVMQEYEDEWYLIAVVNDEWTT